MNPIFVAFGLGFSPSSNYSALHACLCTITLAMTISDLTFQNCTAKVLLFFHINRDNCPKISDNCLKVHFYTILEVFFETFGTFLNVVLVDLIVVVSVFCFLQTTHVKDGIAPIEEIS